MALLVPTEYNWNSLRSFSQVMCARSGVGWEGYSIEILKISLLPFTSNRSFGH